MRTSLLIIALLATTACVRPIHKSVEPSAAYPTAVSERPPVRGADGFVQSYRASVAAETERLRAARLGPDWDALRPIVDAYFDTSNDTRPEAAVLRPIRIDSMTNLLLSYGYRAAHLADQAQARLVVQAADLSGTETTDPVILAPTVLIASTNGIREAADGSRWLDYRVVEPLKNAPPAGRLLSFLLSGPRAPSDVPPPPQPGEEDLQAPGQVVLLLSPPRPGSEERASNGYARMTPMRIEGQTVHPTYHSGAPETTLERVREVSRSQVCAPGYLPVGSGGHGLKC